MGVTRTVVSINVDVGGNWREVRTSCESCLLSLSCPRFARRQLHARKRRKLPLRRRSDVRAFFRWQKGAHRSSDIGWQVLAGRPSRVTVHSWSTHRLRKVWSSTNAKERRRRVPWIKREEVCPMTARAVGVSPRRARSIRLPGSLGEVYPECVGEAEETGGNFWFRQYPS